MEERIELALEAGCRWLERSKKRQSKIDKLETEGVAAAETPERIGKRLARLKHVAEQHSRARVRPTARGVVSPRLVERIGLERVIGDPDFKGMDFFEMAMAMARTVGRIRVRTSQARGFGTGFLVSPRLMLTNHHVLPDRDAAAHSQVQFDYQEDRNGHLLEMKTFELDPRTLFIADEALDYALVAVRLRSVDGVHELKSFGWNRLIRAEGKALLGDPLNIVQHPRGEPKQIVVRGNRLLDLLKDFAHYETDTEPGSSGSPVFSDQWEVVALHHSGVPLVEGGQLIDRDGRVWDGVDPADIHWVANEGVRVSRIVEDLVGPESDTDNELLREMLTAEPPDPISLAEVPDHRDQPEPHPEPPVELAPALTRPGATWTIPLQVTVQLAGQGAALVTGGTTAPAPVAPLSQRAGPPDFEEAISIDPDYGNRRGYDENFLGEGALRVRIPWLTNAQYQRVAFNQQPGDGPRHVLPYHHFSVVLSRPRRLAYFTAANIDGRQSRSVTRESDRWFYDPRIPREVQANNDVYVSNPLDRGHLVRRLDPAWGDSVPVAKVANDDTFHWTNCAPQHQSFNRRKTTWGGVEDYILDNARAHDLRVTVFTGPVFREDDPLYQFASAAGPDSIQLPQQFWKVVAILREDGELSATAYLLSQAALVDDMLEEDFAFGAYRTFQVPLSRIEELTELSFRGLGDFDPLESQAPEGAFESAGARVLPLRSVDEIVL